MKENEPGATAPEQVNHYFKVDRRIAEISEKALSEKALKVYLLHCRRINPKRNLGCSLAGANDARKYLGIPDKHVYSKAVKELEEKHLIAPRPDIKAGYLKAVPVEVLKFPLYDAKNRRFTQDLSLEHQHRTYGSGEYISIPSVIVDQEYLKQFNTETILTMLKLYNKLDFKTWFGVDIRYLHCYCDKNPKGYKPRENYNGLSEAERATKYKVTDKISCTCVNELVDKGLFHYKPALVYQDPDDPDYSYPITLLNRNDNGKYYLDTPKNPGQKVIEIIQPEHYTEAYFKAINE